MEQEISATKEEPMILADNLVKIYKTAELEVLALQGLDLPGQVLPGQQKFSEEKLRKDGWEDFGEE